jgi:stage III sporulation protein AB
VNGEIISIIAGGILFLVSAYVGMAIKHHYKKRRDFFIACLEFIDVLTDEISFLKTPLPDIILRFKEGKKGEFISLLNTYNGLIAEGKPTDAAALNKSFQLHFLNTLEKEALITFFATLGKTDAQTQLLGLKNHRAKTEVNVKASEAKYKTTGLLAYKLGVLIGIAVMIFVV